MYFNFIYLNIQVYQSKASFSLKTSTSEKHLGQDKLVTTENSGHYWIILTVNINVSTQINSALHQ